ncbi:FecR family protein [Chitinophaga niabensis]|uniref:FecR protein n=1 Tax=Chitinophaga niabensis TaxID=536979 RepID=A0A1N6EWH6_9BACT|nr:FecR family protein [Chitinophaga niabensis]SIN87415.1 FecR protein [Chitinophaga niabensis]
MNREEVISLMEKYAAGSLSAEEEQHFRSWMEQVSPAEFQSLLNEASHIPAAFKAWQSPSPEFIQRLEQRLDERSGKTKIFTLTRMVAAASVIVLAVIAAVFYYNREPQARTLAQQEQQPDVHPGGNRATLQLGDGTVIALDSANEGELTRQGNTRIIKLANGQLAYQGGDEHAVPVFNTITTPNGGQYQIELPDGSKAWLNAASSLRFPSYFAGGERVVELEGEGYFEIAANAAQPFRVKIREGVVEVLGTSFNINAYADESAARTTLLQGAVKVHKGTAAMLLKPGQQAVMSNGTITRLPNADTEQAIAWKNGFFQFDGIGLPELMRQISRWYNLEVKFEGKIPEREFAGKISRDVNLQDVLKALQINGVNFKRTGNILVVTP